MGLDVDLVKAGIRPRAGPLCNYTFAERFLPYASMLRSDRWKYLCETCDSAKSSTVAEWLFDLRDDPAELRNLIGKDDAKDLFFREKHTQFTQNLMRITPSAGFDTNRQGPSLGEELREGLKALGYAR
jgi:hypothetical protein